MTISPLRQSDIKGLPVHRGKVRDVYDLGDKLLVVATDRVSAFDAVFPDPIPLKGYVLTQISKWWFNKTKGLVPNHYITSDFAKYPEELQPYRDQLDGRSMLVKKAKPFMGEYIVRGYLDGSAYKQYEFNKIVCGIELLAGLEKHSSFGAPLFTPSTKSEQGHDLNVDFQEFNRIVGEKGSNKGREYSIALYTYAHNLLFEQGLVLSDTKFEFGELEDGTVILIDEVLTPDSSRFWLKETYGPGKDAAISLDKQYIRDFVEKSGWDKNPPAPKLPEEVIKQTTERYLKAYKMITGSELEIPESS